jgi:hypothetical protein
LRFRPRPIRKGRADERVAIAIEIASDEVSRKVVKYEEIRVIIKVIALREVIFLSGLSILFRELRSNKAIYEPRAASKPVKTGRANCSNMETSLILPLAPGKYRL